MKIEENRGQTTFFDSQSSEKVINYILPVRKIGDRPRFRWPSKSASYLNRGLSPIPLLEYSRVLNSEGKNLFFCDMIDICWDDYFFLSPLVLKLE